MALTLFLMALLATGLALKLSASPDSTSIVGREVKQWEEAVDAAPGSATAHAGLGVALLAAGRTSEAKRAFEDALRLDPAEWTAAVRLGELVSASNPERAEALFNQSAASAPRGSKAEAYLALGSLYLERDDPEAARDAFEDAAADNPYVVDARVSLARALEELGDKAAALEQYREAARFDPTNPVVLEAISRLEGQP